MKSAINRSPCISPSSYGPSRRLGLGGHTFLPNQGPHFKFPANSINMNESITMDVMSESDVSCQIVRMNAND